MTQLEVLDFDLPSWNQNKKTSLRTKETWVLFDYKNRDPLTNNANVIRIKKEE